MKYITGTPIETLICLIERQKKEDFSLEGLCKPHLITLRKLGLLVGNALTAEAYELTTKK